MNPSTAPLASLLGILLAACSAPGGRPSVPVVPEPKRPARLAFQPVDADTAARLSPLLDDAVAAVESFFESAFPRPFTVTILPDRAAFDASLPPEWGLGRSECWMVASGVADGVRLLNPRAWAAEACEHDAADELHVRRLLAHELVHVFHAQRNPSPDFVDVSGIDWFVEGLAALASGQLEDETRLSARQALESGAGPARLASAWSGKHRYGVSGSLVAYLERELGRARLGELLGATSLEELLALIGMDEEELLGRWRGWVLAP
jgi:hypothetical protein